MHVSTPALSRRRRFRATLWSLLAVVALAITLPTLSHVLAQTVHGVQADFSDEHVTNPRSDMWRDAREGGAGFTAQTGPYVTNTLISNVGENWRQIRTGPMVQIGGWGLLVVLGLISLFFALRGRIRIDEGRSGLTVMRWRLHERFLHWFCALAFLALTVTGLSLLFGRYVLIPVLGHAGFAAYAQHAYNLHNIVGPAFSVGVLLMLLLWARHNMPKKVDLVWFAKGGGLIGKAHPSAGMLNGGEKLWFWLGVVVFGLVVSVSGFILLFPNLGFQTREIMAWSQMVHAFTSLVWIAFFMGHAYIGTLGTEGALEGMTRGRVDTNWARQHHDLWYERVVASGEQPQPAGALRGASVEETGNEILAGRETR
jgi:formate dehydrogenase subunit gamma